MGAFAHYIYIMDPAEAGDAVLLSYRALNCPLNLDHRTKSERYALIDMDTNRWERYYHTRNSVYEPTRPSNPRAERALQRRLKAV